MIFSLHFHQTAPGQMLPSIPELFAPFGWHQVLQGLPCPWALFLLGILGTAAPAASLAKPSRKSTEQNNSSASPPASGQEKALRQSYFPIPSDYKLRIAQAEGLLGLHCTDAAFCLVFPTVSLNDEQ